jgi:type I restriction enzyme S subunit
MKYQTYPAYKDSGVEWLGEVPEHWYGKSLNYMISHTIDNRGRTPPIVDAGIPMCEVKQVAGNRFYTSNDYEKFVTQESYSQFVRSEVKENDVLFVTVGATFGKTCLVPNSPDFFIAQNLVGFRCKDNVAPKFFMFLLLSGVFKEAISATNKSNTIDNVKVSDLVRTKLVIPTFEEQQKIAQFLDHETAKIDTLIEKQQRLIELLKEKRQAVISHAVTKGLNPNAPMKDSGVEWLGNVPEGWEVRTVAKSSNKITNGYVGQTKDILVDEGVPYIQATHIKRGKVNFDGAYFVRQNWSDAHSKSILSKDDVLIVQTGAGTGDIGLVTEKEEGFNCHALIIVEPVKTIISGDFLSMVFQSQYGYSKLYSIRTGGMHPHLNCGEVQFVKLPIPPRDEQNEIINYIERNVTTFDLLINKQLDAIELMQERRTALISAAVTGKIDVRDWGD